MWGGRDGHFSCSRGDHLCGCNVASVLAKGEVFPLKGVSLASQRRRCPMLLKAHAVRRDNE